MLQSLRLVCSKTIRDHVCYAIVYLFSDLGSLGGSILAFVGEVDFLGGTDSRMEGVGGRGGAHGDFKNP